MFKKFSHTVKIQSKHRSSFYFFLNNFLNLFILGRAGSSLLRELFSSCSTGTSHLGGGFCYGARAPGTQGQELWLPGSRAQTQQLWHTGLVCFTACGILPDQEQNLCLLPWQVDSTTEPPGKPQVKFFFQLIIEEVSRKQSWFKERYGK